MFETLIKKIKEWIRVPLKLKFDRNFLHWAFNFLLFYIGWGFALSGALQDRPYQGPIIIAIFLLYHLFQTRFSISEILTILSVAIIGTINDTIYLNLGLITYKGGYLAYPNIAPLWVTSIWVLFGMCINHSLSWMRRLPLLSSLLGACGGAVSYSAAARIGVAEFHPNIPIVAVIIAIVWAGLMPGILWYSTYLDHLFHRKKIH